MIKMFEQFASQHGMKLDEVLKHVSTPPPSMCPTPVDSEDSDDDDVEMSDEQLKELEEKAMAHCLEARSLNICLKQLFTRFPMISGVCGTERLLIILFMNRQVQIV